jgi:DNA-binding MarR family transcriptional regulator
MVVAASPRPSSSVLAAWRALLVGHAALVDRLDAELRAAHDLPLDWYDVLFQLHEAGGSRSMGELAEAVLIGPSNCTRLVDRLVVAGLVERRRGSADSRMVEAVLTTSGRRLQRRAAVTHLRGVQTHLGAFVDDAFADRITEALGRASASCRAEH